MAQTIYQQALNEARKKAKAAAGNAISNVTLPQGNPAGQGTQGAANTPAANSSPQAAMQRKIDAANSMFAASTGQAAPTSTQGGRTAEGKYRLGDGSTYDTLQEAANANAGANDWEITEVDGETLYDGKPLHNGTGVLAGKGNKGKITSSPISGTYVYDAA